MKKLLFSIHDVTPRHFDRLLEIDSFLQRTSIGHDYAMLVVPNFWGEWPLEKHPEFCEWLRQKSDRGVEMILHGFFHKDDCQHHNHIDRLKAQRLTAGEGEFLGLSASEAVDRVQAGQRCLEGVLGYKASGFIAPAWLYGEAALNVLHEQGFKFAEDHWRIWSPATGKELLKNSPVISYASRSVPRITSSLIWSKLATKLLAPMDVIRMALHPHDFDKKALVNEIDRALNALLKHRNSVTYNTFLGLNGVG
ncbi:DUF2334 domain-containing protein [Kordiimonas gwangyangensis]|uniref:DUF2334 domain-containing protein n=1 Tax=Kordiimonas gwangyangensis TaxID=288022 RepID=UPI00035FA8C7|nr:polysaccharide deacetylase family protein [Kordiimonas gwangyangensis]